MAGLIDIVAAFLQEDNWTYTTMGLPWTLLTAYSGQNGSWDCHCLVHEDYEQVVFYSVCPTAAPEDLRPAMVEFVTRANYGLIIGNFELDLDDGEVRYKTSIDVQGDRLSTALVRQLVYQNVLTMDRYLPGIQNVIQGTPPGEALARVEDEDDEGGAV